MALALGPNEYKGYQKSGGKQNHSGPVGRRKLKSINIYRRAVAAAGQEYWKRYGMAVHGVPRAVRLVYFT